MGGAHAWRRTGPGKPKNWQGRPHLQTPVECAACGVTAKQLTDEKGVTIMTIHDPPFRYRRFDGCEGLDLHGLTRHYGLEAVAEKIQTTPRRLIELRRGFTALTVDDLDALLDAYAEFSLEATVRRIAALRRANGRSRLK